MKKILTLICLLWLQPAFAGLETYSGTFYLNSLNITYPAGSDPKDEGDDHLRGIKRTLKNTFPSITGPVTGTQGQLNYLSGVTAGAAAASKALVTDGSNNLDMNQAYLYDVKRLDISSTASGVHLYINNLNATTDEKQWRISSTALGAFAMSTVDDASTSNIAWLQVDRTGTTIDSIDFRNATAYTLDSVPISTTTSTETFTNKTIGDGNIINAQDDAFTIDDASDPTLQLLVNVAGTTGTNTVLTTSQTANRVLTLPDETDTLVGKTTTDTLTNKTLTSPTINTPTINGGTLSSATATNFTIDNAITGTAIDIDPTLAADSDTLIPSQKAIKTYVDSKSPWNHVGTITTSGAATYTNTSLSPGITAIRLLINGVSTSANTQQIRVRLGSGSFPTSGTAGTVEKLSVANTAYSSGYAPLTVTQGAVEIAYGITDMHITTAAADDWIIGGHIQGGTGYSYNSQGVINLGGDVDRIEISVVSGTFDGGSIEIYEMY